jgi:hypothetical protein
MRMLAITCGAVFLLSAPLWAAEQYTQEQKKLLQDLCATKREYNRWDIRCEQDARGNDYRVQSCKERDAAVARTNNLVRRWNYRYHNKPAPGDPCSIPSAPATPHPAMPGGSR